MAHAIANENAPTVNTWKYAVVAFLLAIFLYLLIVTAWVCDDAYITFRTVDNFVNGFGLRWNVDERVQAFTNPLWMLIVSLFYYFTREAYFTGIILSVGVSMATASVLAFKGAKTTHAAAFVLVALISSRAFVDYSTSGLENPLTNLILAAFVILFFNGKSDRKTLLALCFAAALGMLNRLDTATLLIPALAYSYWKRDSGFSGPTIVLTGFLPLMLWEGFSLFYYGFPFPNTAYAKLNTGIPTGALIAQGFSYLKDSLFSDPVTLIVIASSVGVNFFRRDARSLAVSLGILINLAYVVSVGGDFMSGRFLAAPFITGAMLLAYLLEKEKTHAAVRLAVMFTVFALGLISPRPSIFSGPNYGENRAGLIHDDGIADERAFYYPFTGLIKSFQGIAVPNFPYADAPRPGIPGGWEGTRIRVISERQGGIVHSVNRIGFIGYFGGPSVHIVDPCALSDPLLARLPVPKRPWRIGHFERDIPDGYLETISTGNNLIMDRKLAQIHDALSVITKGDLLSIDRLKKIAEMNWGVY